MNEAEIAALNYESSQWLARVKAAWSKESYIKKEVEKINSKIKVESKYRDDEESIRLWFIGKRLSEDTNPYISDTLICSNCSKEEISLVIDSMLTALKEAGALP